MKLKSQRLRHLMWGRRDTIIEWRKCVLSFILSRIETLQNRIANLSSNRDGMFLCRLIMLPLFLGVFRHGS